MRLSRLFVSLLLSFNLCSCWTARPPQPVDYLTGKAKLHMAVLKGFNGKVWYIGSDDRFDFFRISRPATICRVLRGKLPLERRFARGSDRYLIGFEMARHLGYSAEEERNIRD